MGLMNRKMRRDVLKRGGVENLMQNIHDVLYDEISHNTSVTDMVLTCWVLHTKFGFGEKRIEKFLVEMQELATMASDKKLIEKPLDIREQLYKEVPCTQGRFPVWTELERVKESKKAVQGYIS